MLLEETARKEPFLRYAGAFSINKNSRDIIEALNYAAQLLDDPQNLVLIFPQGKLFPNFTANIKFEKGVMRIIDKAAGKFQLVFAPAFIQYFKHLKPTITETEDFTGKDISVLQEAYLKHHNASKLLQTETEFDI